jgi:mannose-6-phosphate isomerase-like protein (cupin superfamily)
MRGQFCRAGQVSCAQTLSRGGDGDRRRTCWHSEGSEPSGEDNRLVQVDPLLGNAIGSTGDSFVIAEWAAEVGDHWIAPLHVHDQDDEAWYVLEGTLGFRLGENDVEARAGSAVFARRGTPHTYRNAGATPARYLLVMTPRIAHLIAEIHRPGADVAAAFAAHESRLVPEE